MIDTKLVKVWLEKNGIIYLVDHGTVKLNLTNAQDIWETVDQVKLGQARPIFADIRKSKPPNLEVRRYFSQNDSGSLVNAVGLLIESPLSRVIGSFFLGLNKLPVPVQLFSEKKKAIESIGK